jgi:hypothetical protein
VFLVKGIQYGANRCPSALDPALASSVSTIVIKRRHADQGRHLLAIQPAEFGQFAGLRVLTRGLMERERAAVDRAACDRVSSARLIDLFGQATGWLSILIKADEFLSRPGEADDLSRQLDEAVDRLLRDYGDPPDFVFQDDSSEGEQESVVELSLTDRGMLEEIAALRYYSRNLIIAAVEARDTDEYARMVQHYGRLSVRLARLLRRQKVNRGQRMFDQITQAIDEAIDDVLKDWKL